MKRMEFGVQIAHVNEGATEVQTMKDHSLGVAKLAEEFAERITGDTEYGKVGYLLGLLHDVGKYQEGFQKYIRIVSGTEEGESPSSTPHSAAGALWAFEALSRHWTQKIVANCIAGHHRGLYDDSSLLDRLDCYQTRLQKADALRGMGDAKGQISEKIQGALDEVLTVSPNGMHLEDLPMLCYMLFSCLIDADFLDTEAFMAPDRSAQRANSYSSMRELQDLLEEHINQFSSDTPINKARATFSQQCYEHGARAENGLYSLFLPTGGGKTLASMRWALANAVAHGKERVIYVIPYTSIITQTVRVFRDIFGETNVLEHHSDIDVSDEDRYDKTKLLAENWDVPIIVTTNVQFFESIYSNRVGRSRKVHNIANSVVVFDEVQKFPTGLLNPMLRAIESLNRLCRTQILLCTATLPVFDQKIQGGSVMQNFYAISKPIEAIVPYNKEVFATFDKAEYHLEPLELSADELAKRMSEHESFLCITNTRKSAKLLYEKTKEICQEKDSLFHLSRQMCSEHIKDVLNIVFERLKEKKPVKLISTQLIEAGVDVDFPVVYRSRAGLDSIIQAGGRCNREGKLDKGEVFVFNLDNEGTRIPDVKFGSYATDTILQRYKHQEWKVYDTDVIRDYFIDYYQRVGSFDEKGLESCFWELKRMRQLRFDFETAANFRYIEDNTKRIVVPYGQIGKELVDLIIKRRPLSKGDFRTMSKLEVGLYDNEVNKLCEQGSVEVIEWANRTVLVLTDDNAYDDDMGIMTEDHWIEKDLTI